MENKIVTDPAIAYIDAKIADLENAKRLIIEARERTFSAEGSAPKPRRGRRKKGLPIDRGLAGELGV